MIQWHNDVFQQLFHWLNILSESCQMKVGGGDNELINMHIVCLVLIDRQNILVNYLKTTISNNSHCELVRVLWQIFYLVTSTFMFEIYLVYEYTHVWNLLGYKYTHVCNLLGYKYMYFHFHNLLFIFPAIVFQNQYKSYSFYSNIFIIFLFSAFFPAFSYLKVECVFIYRADTFSIISHFVFVSWK